MFRLLAPLLLLFVALTVNATPQRLLEDPENWEHHGGTATSFVIQEGELRIQQGQGEPSAILSREEYENFTLDFEFNYHQWEESGLFLHVPWNGAYRAGIEIELADHEGDAPDPFRAGAIFRHVAPKAVAVHQPGMWNTCKVTMDWPQLHVEINEVVVQDINLETHPRLRHTLRRGRIGFQNNLGWGMNIRNLVLNPLSDTAPAINMFNGADLTGWTPVRNKRAWWTVKDGALHSTGGNGYLQFERSVQDFSLSLYYRCSSSANGGVFFRWMSDDSDRGNEIQILDVPGVGMPSGSIYGFMRGRDDIFSPGEWNLLQVFADGNEVTTYINGHTSAHTDKIDKIRSGHVTLQSHRDGASIEWKDFVLTPR